MSEYRAKPAASSAGRSNRGRRMARPPVQGISTTRRKTMSGTWRSPAPKLRSATQSEQRIITNTPSIIFD